MAAPIYSVVLRIQTPMSFAFSVLAHRPPDFSARVHAVAEPHAVCTDAPSAIMSSARRALTRSREMVLAEIRAK